MPDSPIRFIMLGGFLGAGKTTTLSRLARAYQEQGLRVGIVTNDQASDLVDTHTLRQQGFNVGEVAGACFCCNFNELTETAQELAADERPDVLLAEPVGSCTDLVATVVQPLVQLWGQQFDVAPYGVILKPSHGRRILSGEASGGFSPKAEYIFRKQLEEADFLILNRIDELEPADVENLGELIERERPDAEVLRLSARTGEGFAALLEMLERRGEFGRRILDLDYDIYAEGEAELGWLNASLTVTAPQPIEVDPLLVAIVERLKEELEGSGAETAHLKVIAMTDDGYGVANLISSDSPAELSLPCQRQAPKIELVVNARVATDPAELQEVVQRVVSAAATAAGGSAEFRQTQSFRPGRPVPTHRLAPVDTTVG